MSVRLYPFRVKLGVYRGERWLSFELYAWRP